jgi:hypothetical protein
MKGRGPRLAGLGWRRWPKAAAAIGRRPAVLAALLAVLLAGCSHKPADHRVTGRYMVHGVYPGVDRRTSDGQPCKAADIGYSDIGKDTPVTVNDGSGAVVGRATLGEGRLRVTVLARQDCVYAFSLSLPDRDSYVVEVASRGSVTFSRADLQRAGWTVTLAIGNYAAGI